MLSYSERSHIELRTVEPHERDAMEEVPLIPPDNTAKRHRAKSKRAKKAKKKAKLEQKAAKEAETAHRRAFTVCISYRNHFSSEEPNLSDGCKHDRNTCQACLQRWVEAHLRSPIVVGGVKCPDQCWRILTCEDLRDAIPAELYARYLLLATEDAKDADCWIDWSHWLNVPNAARSPGIANACATAAVPGRFITTRPMAASSAV